MHYRARILGRGAAAVLIAASLLAAAAALAQEAEPADSGLEERVRVNLVEFRILVTDRKGRPITDLTPADIAVFEGGEPQKLAFLESVVGGTGRPAPTGTEKAPPPAMLHTPQGVVAGGDPEAVIPAKPIRRVVLAFDVRNSKMRVRDKWHEAALEWLRTEMTPEDRVAVVVFRSFPDWIVSFTNDANLLINTLEKISMVSGTPDRDRRRDMSRLMSDIRNVCWDPGTADRGRATGEQISRGDNTVDPHSCSFSLVEASVQQWNLETEESVETMRTLAGQLAAIPGRKAVLLFSDGLVADAASMGVNAMIGAFGAERIDMTSMLWRLRRDAHDELADLFDYANAGDVSFFTFDTRMGHDTGFGGNLENPHHTELSTMGINPWSEMNYETRQTLHTIAKETGGRSYHGTKDLVEDLASAADSFFGIYSVGYYRSDPRLAPGKVRVKISRKNLDIDYPDLAKRPVRPRHVVIDLTVHPPETHGNGSDQILPISLTMDFDLLPLRRGAGGRGCQVGIHLQAIRPDGSVVAERLDMETVVTDREERNEAVGKLYRHLTSLVLPTGAFRLRARISDDRQRIVADRTIDLSLELGAVRPGLAGFAENATN